MSPGKSQSDHVQPRPPVNPRGIEEPRKLRGSSVEVGFTAVNYGILTSKPLR